jgi:hypothetical protein
MSKTETINDEITNMEVTRMWYRDVNGRRYAVVKYADSYGIEDRPAEEVPIYVAMEGHQPEELGRLVEELRRYRANRVDKLDDIIERTEKLEESDSALWRQINTKPWWKFWG